MQSQEEKIITKRVGRNVFSTTPLITVVMPAYNVAEYIGEALDSVIAQKFREYEIIVVNDGSPDTRELESALFPYMEDIIYITQQNVGCGPARNVALEHARGEFIAFLDADDMWMPDFLSSQYVYLQRHSLDMVYCDAQLFGMNSAYRQTFMETAPSVGEADFNSILDFRCNVITSGTLARKQSIMDAGAFEPENVRAQDFNLWLRMAKTGARIGYQRKVLTRYRVRLDSLSGDSISRIEREIDALERVRANIELDPEQQQIAARCIAGLEADLAVEQGKSYLLSGDHRRAALAFRTANLYRRSVKLTAITWLARLTPTLLLHHYKKHRPAEIALVPKLN